MATFSWSGDAPVNFLNIARSAYVTAMVTSALVAQFPQGISAKDEPWTRSGPRQRASGHGNNLCVENGSAPPSECVKRVGTEHEKARDYALEGFKSPMVPVLPSKGGVGSCAVGRGNEDQSHADISLIGQMRRGLGGHIRLDDNCMANFSPWVLQGQRRDTGPELPGKPTAYFCQLDSAVRSSAVRLRDGGNNHRKSRGSIPRAGFNLLSLTATGNVTRQARLVVAPNAVRSKDRMADLTGGI